MIFLNGYPRPNGATDFEDSSHLAGLLAITKHEKAVSCLRYISFKTLMRMHYIRCQNSKYDFSRDQFISLAAGLIKQGFRGSVKTEYITGSDILPPSVGGLVRIAQGKKPRWYQSLWLKAEILFHARYKPLEEPNQIIALCSVYGDEYLKLWTKENILWRLSIKNYWGFGDGEWRDEKELAAHIIQYVESIIKE